MMKWAPQGIVFCYLAFVAYVVYEVVINNRFQFIFYLLTYNLGIEIIGRMANLSPMIPWELCKYITGPLVLSGLILEGFKKSNPIAGLLVAMLCLPAILVSDEEMERIVFATFGLLSSGFVLMYLWDRRFTIEQLLDGLRFLLYPLISVLIYITLDTPSFSELEFALGANFDTTGGFGSNQISTILGLGAVLIAMVFFSGKRLFVYQWIDIGLIGYFLFRGLISFSRGGVLSAIVAFVVFFLLVSRAKEIHHYGLKIRKISMKNMAFFLVGVAVVFFVADYVTKGALLLRYQGETSGTLSGEKEITLNTLTTGRFDILVSDIEMWLDHPVWGVGGGISSTYRVNYGVHEIAAHTEYSRVLAEHGLWGLFILLILNFYIPWIIFSQRNRVEAAFVMAFFIIAVLTTFHAGMRTFTTPLLLGMSVIRITPDPQIVKK